MTLDPKRPPKLFQTKPNRGHVTFSENGHVLCYSNVYLLETRSLRVSPSIEEPFRTYPNQIYLFKISQKATLFQTSLFLIVVYQSDTCLPKTQMVRETPTNAFYRTDPQFYDPGVSLLDENLFLGRSNNSKLKFEVQQLTFEGFQKQNHI